MRLTDLIFRPFRTYRWLIRTLRDIELHPELRVKKMQDQVDSEYVVIHGQVMLPSGVYNMIRGSLTNVDYDYTAGRYAYKLHKNKEITARTVSRADYIAMLVAQRFDDASK